MAIPEFATVGGIVMICFLVGMAVKVSPVDDKYIPVIVGVVGGLLGWLGMAVIPDFPGNNVIDAIAVGISSGLAATGLHQIGKQLSQPDDDYDGQHLN